MSTPLGDKNNRYLTREEEAKGSPHKHEATLLATATSIQDDQDQRDMSHTAQQPCPCLSRKPVQGCHSIEGEIVLFSSQPKAPIAWANASPNQKGKPFKVTSFEDEKSVEEMSGG